MKRNFILPSEEMSYKIHDCRTDATKFANRSDLFDVAVLAQRMTQTNKSINNLYNNYLYHSSDDQLLLDSEK
jgi:hypothetical protein